MKLLKDLTVAEVEALLLPGEDEDGEPIEYEYTWRNWKGEVHTAHTQFNSWHIWDEVGEDTVLFLPGLGRVEMIHHQTGGEGASDLQMVFQVTSLVDGSQRLFAIDGQWVSHDGAYWDSPFREVKMNTKVVTYYD